MCSKRLLLLVHFLVGHLSSSTLSSADPLRVVNLTLTGEFEGQTLQYHAHEGDVYDPKLVPTLVNKIAAEYRVARHQLPSVSAFLSSELVEAELSSARRQWRDAAALASSQPSTTMAAQQRPSEDVAGLLDVARGSVEAYDRLVLHLVDEVRRWRQAAETLSTHVAVLKRQHALRAQADFEATADQIARVAVEATAAAAAAVAANTTTTPTPTPSETDDAIGPTPSDANESTDTIITSTSKDASQASPMPLRRYKLSRNFTEHIYPELEAAGVPFILTDLDESWVSSWNLELIRSQCGDSVVNVKRRVRGSNTWGELVNAHTEDAHGNTTNATSSEASTARTLSSFLDEVRSGRAEGLYLHDEPLHELCPGQPLLATFRSPGPFACNILGAHDGGRAANGSSTDMTHSPIPIPRGTPEAIEQLHRFWPSLFVSSPDTSTGLHSDFLDTSFFMVVLSGAKEFRVVDRRDAFLLGPRGKNRFRPSAALSKFARVSTGLVRAGELVYVPSGSPHSVHNVNESGPGEKRNQELEEQQGRGYQPGLAVSVNLVDRQNGHRFLAAVDEFLASGFGYTAEPTFSPATDHAALIDAEGAYRRAIREAMARPCF